MADNEVINKISEEVAAVTNHFSEDIILQILPRLPIKYLLRFRCVCKSWCALIDRPDFIKIATRKDLSIVSVAVEEYAIKVLSVDLDDCEQGEQVEFDYPFPIPKGHYVLTSRNGLVYMFDSIAFSGFTNDSDLPLFLFNPSTRRHKKLPMCTDYPGNSNCAFLCAYGIGYDPTTDDYYVIWVVEFLQDNHYVAGFEVKVYSLSSNSWRKVGNILSFSVQQKVGVFINSAFHWVSYTIADGDDVTIVIKDVIVSVDIKDDEFREVPLPNLVENSYYETMEVGILGEKLQLCVLRTSHVELWVMKDYGVRESWEKQFLIEEALVFGYFKNYVKPICYSKNGEVLFETGGSIVDEYSGALVLYDPHKERASNLRFPAQWPTVCVSSLVSLDTEDGADE